MKRIKKAILYFPRQGFWRYRHIVLFGVLCLFIVVLQAQIHPKQLRKEVLQSQSPKKATVKSTKKARSLFRSTKNSPNMQLAPTVNPLRNRGVTLVYLQHSETLTFDKITNPDMQVLKGNVRFKHDNVLLYCDSAYFFEKANSLNAFGHVRIVQADTLFVFGDMLYYDGNTKLARLRHNVRMENRKTTLTTDSLNYDRLANLSYYYTGGKITDQLNVLTSVWGQYSPSTNDALFKNKVHLKNKNFILDSDTLKYNTKTHIANIVGPTHILYNDETNIYSKLGWYNTTTDQSMLLNRSVIKHKDGKTLTGDTIFYDKKLKYGEGFTHVIMNDTVQKSTLYGEYCYYNDLTKTGLACDSAMLVDWSGKDSMFVHADTLLTSKDSIYNVARGYYHVRLFRNDVQGLCDSLTYSARDSIMNMYGEPVMWSDNNQLSGEFIQAFTKNKKVEHIFIQRAAVAIQHEDSIYYNQLSGKEIIAYVDSGQLKKVKVNGNAETIYYPRDDKDSTLVGLNKTQSSFVVMYLRNKKVQRVVLTSASTGTMYPLVQLSGSDIYLKNFFWLDNQRPKKKQDIFLVFPKVPRPKITVTDPKKEEKVKLRGHPKNITTTQSKKGSKQPVKPANSKESVEPAK
jgi:lipopolysaccharide export system protein LptA